MVGKPVTLSMTPGKHALGKRLRSNALKSSYSNALLISITRSERKLKIATASPSCRPNASQIFAPQLVFGAVSLHNGELHEKPNCW